MTASQGGAGGMTGATIGGGGAAQGAARMPATEGGRGGHGASAAGEFQVLAASREPIELG
jgi:hypothetical protein